MSSFLDRRRATPGAAVLITAAAAVLIAGPAMLLVAGPAAAHVTVNPGEAAAGAFTKLTFRVPNESDTAGTTALSVSFPADSPLAFVSVKPHPGWDVEVTRETFDEPVQVGDFELTDAVSQVTWTAQAGVRIGPGEFDEFEVSVGPLPDEEELLFPVTQTYDDGEVVAWDEPTPAGGEEPEHPAPTLSLTEAEASGEPHDDSTGTGTDGQAAGVDVQADPDAAPADPSDGTARTLGVAGLAVGGMGLVVGAAGLRASRRARS